MELFDLHHAEKKEGAIYLRSFLLWPKQWKQFKWEKKIRWKSIEAKKPLVKTLPDKHGVYLFVITPNVGETSFNGIVAYVGETTGTQQSLKIRCNKYFLKSEHNKRPHVGELMKNWSDNLKLYYTETSASEAKDLEAQFLCALMPPYNRKFPGRFNALTKNLYNR